MRPSGVVRYILPTGYASASKLVLNWLSGFYLQRLRIVVFFCLAAYLFDLPALLRCFFPCAWSVVALACYVLNFLPVACGGNIDF